MMPRVKPATVRLLAAANWVLLGVSWGMSLYSYFRLPQQMATWLSAWQGGVSVVKKSPTFFLLPVIQTVLCVAILAFIRRCSRNGEAAGQKSEPGDHSERIRLSGLKQEVGSLGLIFVNLIFIHFQTTRILVSHRLAAGVNRSYLTILVLILIVLFPYYHIRRQILLREGK